MRLEQKKAIAEEIAGSLREARTLFLTDFTGLDVEAQSELRARLAAEGMQYRVVKNTLVGRALEGLDLPDLAEHLNGPTGLVLAGDDPVAPAKVVRDFAREHDNRPTVKVAVVDRRTVRPDEVERLADLPGREALLASIAGGLTASVGGIAGVLGGLIRDIAMMIEDVAKQGEGQG
ncbi:MAG: 50S ribosomal protein L10 [Gemmatimonadota bacterium]|nr:50S ribosomal protein L10 [Gemmatimonadota bacterium]